MSCGNIHSIKGFAAIFFIANGYAVKDTQNDEGKRCSIISSFPMFGRGKKVFRIQPVKF